jgi:hypothetical protein
MNMEMETLILVVTLTAGSLSAILGGALVGRICSWLGLEG